MKLHTFPAAPSPRRVHLFLAEKGLEIEQVIVDLAQSEHMKPAFAKKSPKCTVPVLELDDGTCLCESVAICRYLEERHPEPALFGRTPEQRALIAERDHWIEWNGLLPVMEGFRNASPRMADHALPGQRPVAQIAALAERGRQCYGWFLEDLDEILSHGEYVAGDEFSVADITALVVVDFATWAIKSPIPERLTEVMRWRELVNSRPGIESAA